MHHRRGTCRDVLFPGPENFGFENKNYVKTTIDVGGRIGGPNFEYRSSDGIPMGYYAFKKHLKDGNVILYERFYDPYEEKWYESSKEITGLLENNCF